MILSGILTCGDGTRLSLPPLSAWELTRTDGEPCGAFSLRFPADGKTAAQLGKAERFAGFCGGKTVFTGVVDECEVRLDGGGLRAGVFGRDRTALLMDRECRAVEFESAQLEDILSGFVRPQGISKISAGDFPAVPAFAVRTGESCWRVLCGFCRHSAGVQPRFAADGTLILRKDGGKALALTEKNGPSELRWHRSRCDEIAEQTIVDLTRRTAESVKNPAGGTRHEVAVRSGRTLKADWHTAAQRIGESRRDSERLELTLPYGFAAEPGDRISAALPHPGIAGRFRTVSASTRCDGGGLRTRLALRPDRERE